MSHFEDVPDDHTHVAGIEWLAEAGITKGANPPENTLFAPDRAVTRAEFATMLHRFFLFITKPIDPDEPPARVFDWDAWNDTTTGDA